SDRGRAAEARRKRVGACRRTIWTAPAKRSRDGAFELPRCDYGNEPPRNPAPASPKRCRRFALPPHSIIPGQFTLRLCQKTRSRTATNERLLNHDNANENNFGNLVGFLS